MDELSTPGDAAQLLGLHSTHAFVYLTQVLQETFAQLEQCTSSEILLSVTAARAGSPGGVLLYASGYLEPTVGKTSPQADAQIAIGVDSICSALQEVTVQRQRNVAAGLVDVTMRASSPANSDLDGAGRAGTEAASLENLVDGVEGDNNFDDPQPSTRSDARDTPGRPPPAVVQEALVIAPRSAGGAGRSSAADDAPSGGPDGLSGSTRNSGSTSEQSGQLPRSVSGGRGKEGVAGEDIDYELQENFSLPGLTALPARIQLPSRRAGSRVVPAPPPASDVEIPQHLVRETVQELMVRGRDNSLRSRLIEFMALFKFVTDTMVKRECTDPVLRDRVDHPYKDLTPDVVRGKTVSLVMASGKRLSSSTPMFRNSREMNTTSALAVVLLMKHLKDPFTLWLIGLFADGAMPPEKLLMTKTRGRGRPQLPVSGSKRPRLGDSTTDVAVPSRKHAGDPISAAPAGGNEAAANAPPDGSSSSVVNLLGVKSLLAKGDVVASVRVHPEFEHFHSRPAPSAVVTVFVQDIVDGSGSMIYPYGQDEHLCLEKGNPASSPALLSAIDKSYRLAWPIADIGYVNMFARVARGSPTCLLLV